MAKQDLKPASLVQRPYSSLHLSTAFSAGPSSSQSYEESMYRNRNNGYHLLRVCYVSGPGPSTLHALEKLIFTANGMTCSTFIYQAQTLAGPAGDSIDSDLGPVLKNSLILDK